MIENAPRTGTGLIFAWSDMAARRIAEFSCRLSRWVQRGAQNVMVGGLVTLGPCRAACDGLLLPSGDEILRKISMCYKERRERSRTGRNTYLAIPGWIDLQGLTIVLKAERRHGEEDVFAIDRFPFLLLTLFGCCGRR